MSKTSEESIRCSFCGREKKEVNVLIAGITGHICDSCISQAHLIVKEEGGLKSKKEINKTKQTITIVTVSNKNPQGTNKKPEFNQRPTVRYAKLLLIPINHLNLLQNK